MYLECRATAKSKRPKAPHPPQLRGGKFPPVALVRYRHRAPGLLT